jgi:hypothetical protein
MARHSQLHQWARLKPKFALPPPPLPKLSVHSESVVPCDRVAPISPPNFTRARRATKFPPSQTPVSRILRAPWLADPRSTTVLFNRVLAPVHTRDTHQLNPLRLTTLNQPEHLKLYPVFAIAMVRLSRGHNNPIKACSRSFLGQWCLSIS